MIDFQSNLNIEDIHVSEEDKNSIDYIKKKTDFLIASLVKEDLNIRKCRDLYDGKRDPKEYEYLQSVYGLETPMSLKMTPLIKTRIDVLIGLLLDETFKYQVSVSDVDTLDKVSQEKMKAGYQAVIAQFQLQNEAHQQQLKNGQPATNDLLTAKILADIKRRIDKSFVSEFEKVAQHLITFFERDKTIELRQKLKQLFLDLLVTGKCNYRTYVRTIGEDPVLEVCKPENVFFNKNTNYQFLSSGNKPNVTAVVHRHYMNRGQVLTEWGHVMTDDDKRKLFGRGYTSSGGSNIITSPQQMEYVYSRQQNNNIHNQHTYNMFDTVTIYHTEWLANNEVEYTEEEQIDKQNVNATTKSKYFPMRTGTGKSNKKGFRLNRYESIRIDYDIYLNCGKSLHEPRSIGAPAYTTLSYNGVAYNDRNGTPYSLAYSLKDLQDLYDITMFHRDNLIANSGVNGSRINLAGIPKVLGQNFMERLLKFVALRKQGVELVDPTEEGASLFQHYGDFKASLDGNSVQALQIVLESIEKQADITSGVNRYMYQAAEQRDAVSNVKTGIKQTSLIVKDTFELIYNIRENMLADLINQAKITYIKGKRGSYVVGTGMTMFSVLPENFCFTDYNIHIINVNRDSEKIERAKLLLPELIGINAVDSNIALKVGMSDSATEIIEIIDESMAIKKEENNQLKQLSDQANQAGQQAKELQAKLQEAEAKLAKLEQSNLALLNRELDIKEKQMENQNNYNQDNLALNKMIAVEKNKKDAQVIQLEREQIYAENAMGPSREVKNDI
jgi:hypothetical protein